MVPERQPTNIILALLNIILFLNFTIPAPLSGNAPQQIAQCPGNEIYGYVNGTQIGKRQDYIHLEMEDLDLKECIKQCYGNHFCYSIYYDETIKNRCVFYYYAEYNCTGKSLVPTSSLKYENKPITLDCIRCPGKGDILTTTQIPTVGNINVDSVSKLNLVDDDKIKSIKGTNTIQQAINTDTSGDSSSNDKVNQTPNSSGEWQSMTVDPGDAVTWPTNLQLSGHCIVVFQVEESQKKIQKEEFSNTTELQTVEQCAAYCYKSSCSNAVFEFLEHGKGICKISTNRTDICNGNLQHHYRFYTTKTVSIQCIRCLAKKPTTQSPHALLPGIFETTTTSPSESETSSLSPEQQYESNEGGKSETKSITSPDGTVDKGGEMKEDDDEIGEGSQKKTASPPSSAPVDEEQLNSGVTQSISTTNNNFNSDEKKNAPSSPTKMLMEVSTSSKEKMTTESFKTTTLLSLTTIETPLKNKTISQQTKEKEDPYLRSCVVTFQVKPFSLDDEPKENEPLMEYEFITDSVTICASKCYNNGCTGAIYNSETKKCVLQLGKLLKCIGGDTYNNYFPEKKEKIRIFCLSCTPNNFKGIEGQIKSNKNKNELEAITSTTEINKIFSENDNNDHVTSSPSVKPGSVFDKITTPNEENDETTTISIVDNKEKDESAKTHTVDQSIETTTHFIKNEITNEKLKNKEMSTILPMSINENELTTVSQSEITSTPLLESSKIDQKTPISLDGEKENEFNETTTKIFEFEKEEGTTTTVLSEISKSNEQTTVNSNINKESKNSNINSDVEGSGILDTQLENKDKQTQSTSKNEENNKSTTVTSEATKENMETTILPESFTNKKIPEMTSNNKDKNKATTFSSENIKESEQTTIKPITDDSEDNKEMTTTASLSKDLQEKTETTIMFENKEDFTTVSPKEHDNKSQNTTFDSDSADDEMKTTIFSEGTSTSKIPTVTSKNEEDIKITTLLHEKTNEGIETTISPENKNIETKGTNDEEEINVTTPLSEDLKGKVETTIVPIIVSKENEENKFTVIVPEDVNEKIDTTTVSKIEKEENKLKTTSLINKENFETTTILQEFEHETTTKNSLNTEKNFETTTINPELGLEISGDKKSSESVIPTTIKSDSIEMIFETTTILPESNTKSIVNKNDEETGTTLLIPVDFETTTEKFVSEDKFNTNEPIEGSGINEIEGKASTLISIIDDINEKETSTTGETKSTIIPIIDSEQNTENLFPEEKISTTRAPTDVEITTLLTINKESPNVEIIDKATTISLEIEKTELETIPLTDKNTTTPLGPDELETTTFSLPEMGLEISKSRGSQSSSTKTTDVTNDELKNKFTTKFPDSSDSNLKEETIINEFEKEEVTSTVSIPKIKDNDEKLSEDKLYTTTIITDFEKGNEHKTVNLEGEKDDLTSTIASDFSKQSVSTISTPTEIEKIEKNEGINEETNKSSTILSNTNKEITTISVTTNSKDEENEATTISSNISENNQETTIKFIDENDANNESVSFKNKTIDITTVASILDKEDKSTSAVSNKDNDLLGNINPEFETTVETVDFENENKKNLETISSKESNFNTASSKIITVDVTSNPLENKKSDDEVNKNKEINILTTVSPEDINEFTNKFSETMEETIKPQATIATKIEHTVEEGSGETLEEESGEPTSITTLNENLSEETTAIPTIDEKKTTENSKILVENETIEPSTISSGNEFIATTPNEMNEFKIIPETTTPTFSKQDKKQEKENTDDVNKNNKENDLKSSTELTTIDFENFGKLLNGNAFDEKKTVLKTTHSPEKEEESDSNLTTLIPVNKVNFNGNEVTQSPEKNENVFDNLSTSLPKNKVDSGNNETTQSLKNEELFSNNHTTSIPEHKVDSNDNQSIHLPEKEEGSSEIQTTLVPKLEIDSDNSQTTHIPEKNVGLSDDHTTSIPKHKVDSNDNQSTHLPEKEEGSSEIQTTLVPKLEIDSDISQTTHVPEKEEGPSDNHTTSIPEHEVDSNDNQSTHLPEKEEGSSEIQTTPVPKLEIDSDNSQTTHLPVKDGGSSDDHTTSMPEQKVDSSDNKATLSQGKEGGVDSKEKPLENNEKEEFESSGKELVNNEEFSSNNTDVLPEMGLEISRFRGVVDGTPNKTEEITVFPKTSHNEDERFTSTISTEINTEIETTTPKLKKIVSTNNAEAIKTDTSDEFSPIESKTTENTDKIVGESKEGKTTVEEIKSESLTTILPESEGSGIEIETKSSINESATEKVDVNSKNTEELFPDDEQIERIRTQFSTTKLNFETTATTTESFGPAFVTDNDEKLNEKEILIETTTKHDLNANLNTVVTKVNSLENKHALTQSSEVLITTTAIPIDEQLFTIQPFKGLDVQLTRKDQTTNNLTTIPTDIKTNEQNNQLTTTLELQTQTNDEELLKDGTAHKTTLVPKIKTDNNNNEFETSTIFIDKNNNEGSGEELVTSLINDFNINKDSQTTVPSIKTNEDLTTMSKIFNDKDDDIKTTVTINEKESNNGKNLETTTSKLIEKISDESTPETDRGNVVKGEQEDSNVTTEPLSKTNKVDLDGKTFSTTKNMHELTTISSISKEKQNEVTNFESSGEELETTTLGNQKINKISTKSQTEDGGLISTILPITKAAIVNSKDKTTLSTPLSSNFEEEESLAKIVNTTKLDKSLPKIGNENVIITASTVKTIVNETTSSEEVTNEDNKESMIHESFKQDNSQTTVGSLKTTQKPTIIENEKEQTTTKEVELEGPAFVTESPEISKTKTDYISTTALSIIDDTDKSGSTMNETFKMTTNSLVTPTNSDEKLTMKQIDDRVEELIPENKKKEEELDASKIDFGPTTIKMEQSNVEITTVEPVTISEDEKSLQSTTSTTITEDDGSIIDTSILKTGKVDDSSPKETDVTLITSDSISTTINIKKEKNIEITTVKTSLEDEIETTITTSSSDVKSSDMNKTTVVNEENKITTKDNDKNNDITNSHISFVTDEVKTSTQKIDSESGEINTLATKTPNNIVRNISLELDSNDNVSSATIETTILPKSEEKKNELKGNTDVLSQEITTTTISEINNEEDKNKIELLLPEQNVVKSKENINNSEERKVTVKSEFKNYKTTVISENLTTHQPIESEDEKFQSTKKNNESTDNVDNEEGKSAISVEDKSNVDNISKESSEKIEKTTVTFDEIQTSIIPDVQSSTQTTEGLTKELIKTETIDFVDVTTTISSLQKETTVDDLTKTTTTLAEIKLGGTAESIDAASIDKHINLPKTVGKVDSAQINDMKITKEEDSEDKLLDKEDYEDKISSENNEEGSQSKDKVHTTTEPPVEAVADLVHTLSRTNDLDLLLRGATKQLVNIRKNDNENSKEKLQIENVFNALIDDRRKGMEQQAFITEICNGAGRLEFQVKPVSKFPRLNITHDVPANSPAECAIKCKENGHCDLAGFIPSPHAKSSGLCLLTSDTHYCDYEDETYKHVPQHQSEVPFLLHCIRCSKCRYNISPVIPGITEVIPFETTKTVSNIEECALQCSNLKCTIAQFNPKSLTCSTTINPSFKNTCPMEKAIQVDGGLQIRLHCVNCTN